MAIEALEDERLQLHTALEFPKLSATSRMKLQRRLWLVEGVLTLGLNSDLLSAISAKFSKIGAVPQGYNYPELF